MKMLAMLTAGLVAATGLIPIAASPAEAQRVVRERTIVHYDNGRRNDYRNYRRAPRKVCTVRYRRGERIRTCRTVRRR